MYLDDESEAFRKQPFIAFRFLPFHRDDYKVRGICMMTVFTTPPPPPPSFVPCPSLFDRKSLKLTLK